MATGGCCRIQIMENSLASRGQYGEGAYKTLKFAGLHNSMLSQSADDRSMPPPLILIVEDEMMLAMLQEDQLRDLGYESVKAARVAPALRLADQAPLDAALLDVNLAGETSYPVAESLRRRSIPFIFATNYGDRDEITTRFGTVPVLRKPYFPDALAEALAAVLPK
jgi:CheY-like chemotaxis protein